MPGLGTAGPGAMSMPQQMQDPLAGLRDIHLPDAIDQLALTPGWLALAILAAIAAAYLTNRLLTRWQMNRYRKEGLKQLEALFHNYALDEDKQNYLTQFSSLLKRIALTRFPRESVAAKVEEDWVAFLDRTGATNEFSMGAGQVLIAGNYEPSVRFDVAELHAIGKRWIKDHQAGAVTHA